MLVNKSEILKKNAEETKAAASSDNQIVCMGINGRGYDVIKKVIGNIKQGETIDYWTEGQWSAHTLLEHLLQLTGPAKLYFTTWAMSENPVRVITNLIKDGYITELNCVFDVKTQDRAPKVFQLMNSIVTRVKLAHCHAKIFVIENDNWLIVNNGSANWTENPRTESGFISADKKRAAFYRDCILKKINSTEAGNECTE